jgi:cysteine-rich repeat protein
VTTASSTTASSVSASSTSTGIVPPCGDGSLDPGEECDDGNVMEDDGCDARCVVECSCPTCFKGTQEQPVCYRFGETQGSRALGEAACIAWCTDGCELAQVHDEAELAAINAGLQALGTQGTARIWVGGVRVASDFTWSDGTALPADSTLWFMAGGTCPVEPTNLDPPENGIILWDCPDDDLGFSYKLADHNEASALPHLCERRPAGAP